MPFTLILLVLYLPNQGNSYILTCIDRFTRWPEAIPIPNITAKTMEEAFVTHWIAHFGVPSIISTDRGSQLESALWEHLMQLLRAKRICTTAYHPMSNGLVELFHLQLKASLKCQPIPAIWVSAMPLVLLGIRTAHKQNSCFSAEELVYGTTLHLPGEFFVSTKSSNTTEPFSYVAKLYGTLCSNCMPHQCIIQNDDRHTSTRPWHPASMILCGVMQYDLPCNFLMMGHTKCLGKCYVLRIGCAIDLAPPPLQPSTPAPTCTTHSGRCVHWLSHPCHTLHQPHNVNYRGGYRVLSL